MPLILIDSDIERYMLIHRITSLWVVSDGILGGHAHPAILFIQMTSFFTKTEEMILGSIYARVVAKSAQLVSLKSTLFQIAIQRITLQVIQRKAEGFLA